MKKTKLFIVDTLVTFRNRYVVEAECIDHAYDEVTMIESGNKSDYFDPFSQLRMTEAIIDGRKISRKTFRKMIKDLENDKNPQESGSYWMGEDLIRVINYNTTGPRGENIYIGDEE